MCLRDRKGWFKERLCRFIVWFGESHELSKDEAEKRERLVETYLVLFCLLLSFSGRRGLMKWFIVFFIMVSVFVFSMPARSVGSKPTDKADKQKRLFTTFIAVCLVGTSGLQAGLMKYFIAFLVVSLIYYSMLALSVGSKPFRNLMALMAFVMACIFSSAFVSYYVAFPNHPVWRCLLFCVIASTVALPLLV